MPQTLVLLPLIVGSNANALEELVGKQSRDTNCPFSAAGAETLIGKEWIGEISRQPVRLKSSLKRLAQRVQVASLARFRA